jgi:RHS repeat-associated protein
MYDEKGQLVWETHLDIYGKVRTFAGRSLSDCPFRYQGQYEDEETGLYYNRFRYYSPEEGIYLSKDPIRLNGGSVLYAYVHDTNSWVDVSGLAKRGPKTGGEGTHNQTIKAWGDEVIANGGTIISGGGYEKEKLYNTPNGHKSGRRPDIVWKDAEGKTHFGNVGKTNAKGKPVNREILAMQDLNEVGYANGASDRVHFRSYNHPDTNKISCH